MCEVGVSGFSARQCEQSLHLFVVSRRQALYLDELMRYRFEVLYRRMSEFYRQHRLESSTGIADYSCCFVRVLIQSRVPQHTEKYGIGTIRMICEPPDTKC